MIEASHRRQRRGSLRSRLGASSAGVDHDDEALVGTSDSVDFLRHCSPGARTGTVVPSPWGRRQPGSPDWCVFPAARDAIAEPPPFPTQPRGLTHSCAAIRVRATPLPMNEARLHETSDGSLVSPSSETYNRTRTPERIGRRNGNAYIAYIAAGASGFGHTTTVSRRDRAHPGSTTGPIDSHRPVPCHQRATIPGVHGTLQVARDRETSNEPSTHP